MRSTERVHLIYIKEYKIYKKRCPWRVNEMYMKRLWDLHNESIDLQQDCLDRPWEILISTIREHEIETNTVWDLYEEIIWSQ